MYSWKDATEASSTDLLPNRHGAVELGLKRRCYSYDAGNTKQQTKKGRRPRRLFKLLCEMKLMVGFVWVSFPLLWWVWMQSVKDMKGNTWMKMTFFLYLNVEIKTFSLIFRINKMLLLTSACDFSFVNTLREPFFHKKRSFLYIAEVVEWFWYFSFVSWFPVLVGCIFFNHECKQ